MNHNENRIQSGYQAGITGVIVNICLFSAKLVIGIFVNSIAIIADAINNLSDVAASAVTLFGFKVSSKPADEEHPFGHGRIEYITSLVVSILVLLVGVEFVKTSYERIVHPEPVKFSVAPFIILILSILVKIALSIYYNYIGRKINSDTLKATSIDSLSDVFTSSVVLISFILIKFTRIPLDGYIGLTVSLIIIYAGINLIRSTINPLIGSAPDHDLVQSLCQRLLQYPNILGVHDLLVHNYGPGRTIASIHAEVPSNLSLIEVHDIIDQAEREISSELGIHLVIHMDPVLMDEQENEKAQQYATRVLSQHPGIQSFDKVRLIENHQMRAILVDCELNEGYGQNSDELKAVQDQLNQALEEIDDQYQIVLNVKKGSD